MRMSCNGCRVLRKGCNEGCSIRPCLQWIACPDSQSNVTLFLAKFYGRAGLLNLISAGPEHLRPAIFRSLLYEACGRIVNPIYGSVGLLWSASWHLCQAAVEAVLKGEPIVKAAPARDAGKGPPLQPHDIRHVSKQEHHRCRTRTRFKRAARPPRPAPGTKCRSLHRLDDLAGEPSPDLATSHHSDQNESGSALSVETVDDSSVSRSEPETNSRDNDAGSDMGYDLDLDLELSLGFRVACDHAAPHVQIKKQCQPNTCKVDVDLDIICKKEN